MERGKVEKLVTNFHNKNEYLAHIRNLKQTLNHGLILKKVHGVTKLNHKAWLESYLKIKTDIRKIAKIILIKTFLSSRITQFLEKLWRM